MERSAKDILAGLTFLAFGAAFAVGALAYPIGSATRMGPGFFPLLVGVVLAALGAVVAIKPAFDPDREPLTPPGWRGLALIPIALLAFGLTVRGLGLVPSLLLTAFLAALASRQTSVLTAALMAIGLTVVSVLIFIVALRLNLPLLGPWIPRL